MIFVITNRFNPNAPALVFHGLDDRAGKGTWGFLGSGIPMLPEERREFQRMIAERVNLYIGTSKVLNIVKIGSHLDEKCPICGAEHTE